MGYTPQQKRLIDKQKLRIAKALLEGKSEKYIMAVEGADPKTVGDVRKSLKGQLPKGKGKTPEGVYGLTSATNRIRSYLGNRVNDLLSRPLERWQISPMIGLTPMGGINAAKAKPGRHDWKMSELERLAKAGDTTFIELILNAARPPEHGFDQAEKDKWNSMIARFHIG